METSVSGMACRCGTCDDCRAARTARKDARHLNILQPDLELVAVPRDESFKVWSHGYPYRTVRWHFHPEYEIQLITVDDGQILRRRSHRQLRARQSRDDGTEPAAQLGQQRAARRSCRRTLPHPAVRCRSSIAQAIEAFPELKRVESLARCIALGRAVHAEDGRGRRADHARDAGRARHAAHQLVPCVARLARAKHRAAKLASAAYRADPSHYAETRINHVLSYIGKNLSQELRETELAELAGQSASAFSRYFRRHTGVPFVQYVNRLRINLACQLLMSGELSITDICYQVGFNNLSNFNRQFLLLKEMSPSRWRAYQQLNAASATESSEAAHALEAVG